MTVGYASTRGQGPEVDFADALLTGLASDGGLFCPVEVPELPDLAGLSMVDDYAEVAHRVMWPYVEGSIDAETFATIVAEAYQGFRDPAVCPLLELGDNQYLLDLTQGPTLAFKDVALQLVGRLLDLELDRRGKRAVVISATSGDTGSAAIEALAGRDNVQAVVLHPNGRVSDVQRRQMTTVLADNVHNLAVEGTFDDCQDLVKAAFADSDLNDRYGFAAVNSINWARVMAQIVYFVTSARTISPDNDPVSFSVPTGNFGNILSGWYGKRMGLAVDQLIVASNRNDVLTRVLAQGELTGRDVVPTLSPSMDIQVSSNFERLLWESSGRDGAAIAEVLSTFRSTGSAAIDEEWMTKIRREFTGVHLDDEGTIAEMRRVHDETGIVIDPHTAVGVYAARVCRRDPAVPMITLATAAPAKFPDAVEQAIGSRPELPPFLSELFDRQERFDVIDNNLGSVADYLDRL